MRFADHSVISCSPGCQACGRISTHTPAVTLHKHVKNP